jgi:hypothetical protein
VDAERFDRVVRFLGRRRSRRGFAGLVAGALVAGALPLTGEAAFRTRPDGAVCVKNADCDSDYCAPKNSTGRRLCGQLDPCGGINGVEGEMFCAGQTGFCTIDHGVGVFRACALGTVCREFGEGQIICDWPA